MPEKILEMPSSEQFKQDYTRYGIYILYRRVLSDYRDGLKPVQRRIIYAMLHDTKAVNTKIKSAAVVGDVMKLYHPHGDCLDGDTVLYCLNNTKITIKQVFELGLEKLDILAVDPNTKQIVPAIATNFRIGQYTTKKYMIHLSNGSVISTTANHPIMLADGNWVCAENILPYTRIYTKNISLDSGARLKIGDRPVHEIVHDFYNGPITSGLERHHVDGNFYNNLPENIVAISKNDHINIHKGNDHALDGLEAGRQSMFSDDGKYRERTKKKNSILASEFNKDQGIRRFKYVINLMKESNMEITESNYESFRGKIYNLPFVSRLIERHPEYGKTFEDLVNYIPTPLNELFESRRNELDQTNEKVELMNPIEFFYDSRFQIYRVFDHLIDNNIPLSVDAYFNQVHKYSKVDPIKVNYLINLYMIERPYVVNVEILDVPSTPMYDFTVKNFENMLIPVETQLNNTIENQIGFNMPLICVHNSSIYDTMKPLANWFECNMPLIYGEGNWGTMSGDPAAASRYTECRLSKFCIDAVLGDLIDAPESADWSPTYNESTMEPNYIPVKVPLLLINGSFGIGLGLRADIPSHNLNEVIDATLALMDNPNIDTTLIPDHNLPCEIYDTDFSKISRMGFGHYKIRGKIDLEDYHGKKALIIRSIPNQTYLDSVLEKLDNLIKSKKLIQIDAYYDQSTQREMKCVIVLKHGADPNYVKDVLYKNTNLEQTIRVNFETLNGFNPLRMSYKSYLLSFLDFRRMTKFRVYSNKLQDVQTSIHERDAFIKILESGQVDEVISRIKKQKETDDTELIEWLIKNFKITDLQSKYIINASLKKLSLGYLEKYKQEAAELEVIKADLMNKIMDDRIIEQDIRQELLDIKKKYGRPRNCTVISANEGSEIPKGEMVVCITERNFIKKVPSGTSLGNFRNDSIKSIIRIDNTDNILLFDATGRVFKLPVHKIPFTDRNSNGTDIRFMNKLLTANISAIIPESVMKRLSEKGHHNNKNYLVTLTSSGLIKRMDLDDFLTVPLSGIIYAKIDKEDSIKDIIIAHSNFSIVVYANRKATIFKVNDIPYLKRNTKGSKAISGVDSVDGICVIHNNCTDIVTITESGKVNRINLTQGLPNTGGKGKSGFNLIKLSQNDKIVGVVSGNENDAIHIKCINEDSIINIADLKIGSSISTGDKILSTRSNKIIRCYIDRK